MRRSVKAIPFSALRKKDEPFSEIDFDDIIEQAKQLCEPAGDNFRSLTPKERRALQLSYGLLDGVEKSDKEGALELGVSAA